MNIVYVLLLIVLTIPSIINTQTFLIFGGKTGWVGQQLVALLQQQGHTALCAAARLENRGAIIAELETYNPDFVINAAGITGRPNVDWCEDHKEETIRANVLGALNLADITFIKGIHLTNISTGCIYQYDEKHPLKSGIGFTEEDEPNFAGSFYSHTKILAEKLIRCYPHVLHLRLRMPIADDLTQRAFVGKIIHHKKLVDIPNSMAVMHDLLPLIIDMTQKKYTGIYNFVNPGTLSHHEVIELYKQYINPTHQYESFTVEEQDRILKAPRSNCELDATKLLSLYPNIPSIKESIVKVFERMKKWY
jgi:3,5-epimerase/4-reductase